MIGDNDSPVLRHVVKEFINNPEHKNSYRELAMCHFFLSDLYMVRGDFGKAYQYRLMGDSVQEIIKSKAAMRNMEEMKTRYESEKKDLEIPSTKFIKNVNCHQSNQIYAIHLFIFGLNGHKI